MLVFEVGQVTRLRAANDELPACRGPDADIAVIDANILILAD